MRAGRKVWCFLRWEMVSADFLHHSTWSSWQWFSQAFWTCDMCCVHHQETASSHTSVFVSVVLEFIYRICCLHYKQAVLFELAVEEMQTTQRCTLSSKCFLFQSARKNCTCPSLVLTAYNQRVVYGNLTEDLFLLMSAQDFHWCHVKFYLSHI